MNKIVSIKLPILALAMAFTISCSSDKDSGENLGSGGENSNVSNEQGSSSSFVQSSSSSLVQSSSSHTLCKPTMVGTGTEYVTGCAILELHFTDARDGKIYRYAEIGTQTWMAENLNYAAEGSKCGVVGTGDTKGSLSDANTLICDRYGRLYDWATATNACPNGWHLPNDADWEKLMKATDPSCSGRSCGGAGKKLKAISAISDWNDYEGKSGGGTNDFRFSALPGGSYSYSFTGVGEQARWWSASENNASTYTWDIYYFTDDVLSGASNKSNLHSVRCVKN